MSLALVGKYSLDTMEAWVKQYFSPVKNFDVVIPDLGVPAIWSPEFTSKLLRVVPVKDEHKLSLAWPLPYCEKQHESKPLNYFSHLAGHEGKNSLLSYLK